MNTYNIKVQIEMEDEVIPEILELAISPENITMPTGKVITYIDEKRVITEIKGEMGIGRLIHTLDDILKAAILAKDISKTVDSSDLYQS